MKTLLSPIGATKKSEDEIFQPLTQGGKKKHKNKQQLVVSCYTRLNETRRQIAGRLEPASLQLLCHLVLTKDIQRDCLGGGESGQFPRFHRELDVCTHTGAKRALGF